MKSCLLPILMLSTLVFTSCEKPIDGGVDQTDKAAGKLAPDGFNFETSRKVNVTIRLMSNIDEPLSGIIIDVNKPGGETILRGVSDASGYFQGIANIPSYIDTLLITPNNPGLNSDIKALIVNNAISCVIGGRSGGSGNMVMSRKSNQVFSGATVFAPTTYSYMGTYDINGRPVNYLDPQKGAVTADLLSYLAESLPDRQDVRVHHPQYLSDNATEHLNIISTSDVWITFVSEGGGYNNTIGYYTYSTNNPPNVVNKITDVKYIFPNCSALGSGGNMQSGDRVKLGTFSAGTSIGFVLLQNGWSPSVKSVNTNVTKFYSDSPFNPESTSALRTHTVLLNYAKENLFIIGFEDLVRSTAGSDHDFNDVVLYANAVPSSAISTAGVQGISPPKDTDGDGVWDVNDKFPTDATRAYISYFPSETTKGTLVFEDNWPSKGDYDMNDLVVTYQYKYISNSSNKVVEMYGDYRAVAAWAKNENGLGIQFPFAPSLVKSVFGQKLNNGYISLSANDTEAGQSKTVIVPFDGHRNLLLNQTDIIDSAIVKITFVNPVDMSAIGPGPYNPFLICSKQRGIEAHLPGHPPTDRADNKYFGTEHDRTNKATNKYYLSEENWPWALSFTETFRYPIEGNAINAAYLHFGEWASSGGTIFTDWYKNTSPGYRDDLKIR
jgi:LruC domain-containing protein